METISFESRVYEQVVYLRLYRKNRRKVELMQ